MQAGKRTDQKQQDTAAFVTKNVPLGTVSLQSRLESPGLAGCGMTPCPQHQVAWKRTFPEGKQAALVRSGLVQQTVQIVASHDLTLIVGPLCRKLQCGLHSSASNSIDLIATACRIICLVFRFLTLNLSITFSDLSSLWMS